MKIYTTIHENVFRSNNARVAVGPGLRHSQQLPKRYSPSLNWLRQSLGGELDFHWSSGIEMPSDLESYKLIVHCGACIINQREMLSRMMAASAARVPVVNDGVLIAYVLCILRRALEPFPDVLALLDN
ncbi:hypothetical protein [Desulfoscipio gibsoniae]|uniref:hypothetical protein n=1 Tax=Desulfoscipio gibsoniae TaxID=102134 RepID=UPI000232BBC1